jgi:nicotinamide-nucleotide amidase
MTNAINAGMPSVEIITIGDELLIGQTIDTNSAYIATILNLNGISVKQITSVSDNEEHIIYALNDAQKRANIILMTGGLGPTKDDITKKTLCKYFNTGLRFDEEAFKNITRLFTSYGREVTPLNRMQAEVPTICETIYNEFGTAPGMWFVKDEKIIVSMPGVPYEMKAMLQNIILPKIKKQFTLPHIIHKIVLTQGIGESFLADLISKWEDSLSPLQIKLAYLPSIDIVRLRLSTKGYNADELNNNVNQKIEELKQLIPQYICGLETYGEEKETLEQIIGKLLKEKQLTIATAESCTGGYLAHLITSVAGSSEYYVGSVIAYSDMIKELELNVPTQLLQEHGAVSQPVVEQMAISIRKKFNTNIGVATSGIAGPSGGTDEKPVGTVWVAVSIGNKIISDRFLFGKRRERNIQKSAQAALNILRKELI